MLIPVGIFAGASSSEAYWAANIYQSGYNIAYSLGSISADSSGNVIIGYSRGSTQYGGQGLHFTKIKSDGTRSWTKNLNISGVEYPTVAGVHTSQSNNIVISSSTNSGPSPWAFRTTSVDSGFSTKGFEKSLGSYYGATQEVIDGSGNMYFILKNSSNNGVLKLSSTGGFLWYKTVAEPNLTTISVDSSQNVYVGGRIYSSGNSFETYVAKLNSSGVEQWQKSYFAGYDARISKVLADSSGNVYIVGSVGNGYSPGTRAQIYKVDSTGIPIWKNALDKVSSSVDILNPSAVTDSLGSIYVVANYHYQSSSVYDRIALVKIDSSGAIAWAKINSFRASTGAYPNISNAKIAISPDEKSIYVSVETPGPSQTHIVVSKIPTISTNSLSTNIGSETVSWNNDSYTSYYQASPSSYNSVKVYTPSTMTPSDSTITSIDSWDTSYAKSDISI